MGEFETWDGDDIPADDGSPSDHAESQDRQATPTESSPANITTNPSTTQAHLSFSDLEAVIQNLSINNTLQGLTDHVIAPGGGVALTPQQQQPVTPPSSSSVTQPVTINIQSANNDTGLSPLFQRGSDGLPAIHGVDGPMTPRNDAGPFVLDGSGSAGRAAGRAAEQRSREAAAAAGSTSTSAPTGNNAN
jgi:hypothetical protein